MGLTDIGNINSHLAAFEHSLESDEPQQNLAKKTHVNCNVGLVPITTIFLCPVFLL